MSQAGNLSVMMEEIKIKSFFFKTVYFHLKKLLNSSSVSFL